MEVSNGVKEFPAGDCTSLIPNETRNRKRIKICQRAAYGAGHVMNDICAAMWFSYTLLFFQVVLGMPPLLAGAMLLIGQVADAVATPIVGVLADRAGSRKSWHLLGTGLVVLSFPLIFSPCPGCQDSIPQSTTTSNSTDEINGVWQFLDPTDEWLRGIYYAILITIFQTGWAIVQISHLALIPDLTPNQSERAELTAIRYTASICSSVLMYLVTWLVLHLTAGETDTIGPGDAFKFRDIVLIGLMIGALFSGWFHVVLKTPRTISQIGNVSNFSISSSKDIKHYFKSWTLYQVSILYVSSRLFLTLSLVYMPLYLVESLGEQAETLATVPLVSYFASFLAALAVKQSSSCLGSKMIYFLGAVISIIGCIWIRIGVGSSYKAAGIYGIAIFLGAGSSVTMVASLCLTADLIGANTESGAFIYSLVTFADKLFNGVAVILIEDQKCSSYWICPHYYRDVLAYVCGGSAVLGLIAVATLYSKLLGNTPKVPPAVTTNEQERERYVSGRC